MDKFDIFKGCKCLYTPMGAAREYAPVGCNFYRGCPYQCKYCYNRKGITSSIMGVDHAVLESCFVIRPKKFRDMSAESYALMCFVNEVDAHLDYLRDMGVFFSFSTDPWLSETRDLTWKCATFAALKGIPVKILTKCAVITDEVRLYASSLLKQFVSFGFTLTGRDDLEPNASTNQERVAAMRELHEMGYKTFASIEPIVDFESSYEMIRRTIGFCDQYLIGLMSKRSRELPPYELSDCVMFIKNVANVVKKSGRDIKVYWKHSIREFVKESRAAKNTFKQMWDKGSFKDNVYCLQKDTDTYPIHALASYGMNNAVKDLKALFTDLTEKQRKQHERNLISFFFYYNVSDALVNYCSYLAEKDIDGLHRTIESILRSCKEFIDAYESLVTEDKDTLTFLTKFRKKPFSSKWVYLEAVEIDRLCSSIMKDMEDYRKYETKEEYNERG